LTVWQLYSFGDIRKFELHLHSCRLESVVAPLLDLAHLPAPRDAAVVAFLAQVLCVISYESGELDN
jgi:hypothetical protein